MVGGGRVEYRVGGGGRVEYRMVGGAREGRIYGWGEGGGRVENLFIKIQEKILLKNKIF